MDSDDNAKGSFENERSYSALEPTTTTFLPSAIISIPNAFIPPLNDSPEDFKERKKLNEALPVAEGATESDIVDHETVPQRPKTAKGERPGSSKNHEDERGT